MNNGVSPEATALATKHKDPKTLMQYVRPNKGLLMQAGMGIGAAVNSCSSSGTQIAGVKLDPPEDKSDDTEEFEETEDEEEEEPPRKFGKRIREEEKPPQPMKEPKQRSMRPIIVHHHY